MTISVEKFVKPVKELADLNVANIEQLIGIQLAGIQEVTNASVDSLKKASALTDMDSIKNYYAGQAEVVKSLVESTVVRSKTAADIAQAYPASVKKIVDNALAIG